MIIPTIDLWIKFMRTAMEKLSAAFRVTFVNKIRNENRLILEHINKTIIELKRMGAAVTASEVKFTETAAAVVENEAKKDEYAVQFSQENAQLSKDKQEAAEVADKLHSYWSKLSMYEEEEQDQIRIDLKRDILAEKKSKRNILKVVKSEIDRRFNSIDPDD